MIQSALTRALNIATPVIAAPLGRGSTPGFLRAVADAGALGFVALRHMSLATIAAQLATYRGETGGRFGVNLTLVEDQHARLEAAIDAGVDIFSFWQGDVAPYVQRAKAARATVFWTVGSAAEAARAGDLGVDFVVAQGREAGGHLVGNAPTMALLPAVVDAANGVPVVAAGGIGDGRGLAAALCLGACGIWMGTRFVASIEAANHAGYKQRIVSATAADIVETRLFDIGWPDAPHRVVRNSTYTRWAAAGCPAPGERPGEGDVIGRFPSGEPLVRYDIAAPWADMDGDWEATALYAGCSAALVRDVRPVRYIIETVTADAAAALRRAGATLPPSVPAMV